MEVFDLENHKFVRIHIDQVEPYVFDTSVGEKLIIPKDHHALVDMLISSADCLMEDIVSGKTGGIVVIASGVPGVGKSLTAQVCAEALKKPLYEVQCSQLGTDEEALELKLKAVLAQAVRWNAVLLIDEADVYIRERSDDIQQNAIVGVFLRLLETYRGVLFMTTNRGEAIDDAIMSRATAWIQYTKPGVELLPKIWEVLSKQYEVELTPELITELVERFPDISGRAVKHLLKLGKIRATRSSVPASLELFEWVSRFQQLR